MAVVALALVVVLIAPFVWRAMASQRKVIPSPDGQYRIVVYAFPSFGMPGSGGDAPGFAQLQTNDGRVLKETNLEMVQLLSRDLVRWESDRVSVPAVLDWALPR